MANFPQKNSSNDALIVTSPHTFDNIMEGDSMLFSLQKPEHGDIVVATIPEGTKLMLRAVSISIDGKEELMFMHIESREVYDCSEADIIGTFTGFVRSRDFQTNNAEEVQS